MSKINIKCNRCRNYIDIDCFIKNNKVLKFCINCRINSIKYSNKNRCFHNKQKFTCKLCGDEIKITIINMLNDSKNTDKKCNRYDADNFIDREFLLNLIEKSNDKCYYCNCDLQYIIRQANLASIERLNNDIGHIKSNCVISCWHCNVARVGNKLIQ